jgi:hypothetical protein
MNALPQPKPTALDELLRLTPEIDPGVLDATRQATELARKLGLLSTSPAEVLSPFARRVVKIPGAQPQTTWATTSDITFDKVPV